MKEQSWFKRFLAGIGIGVGAAIPGVSGAAVALIFRVFETIINAINNFTKHIRKSISTLLPILLGALVAVIICVIVFDWAFEHCMFILISMFSGFLIGSFPSITREVKGVEIKKSYIILAILGGLIVIGLGVASIILGTNGIDVSAYFTDAEEFFGNWWIIIVLFVVGIFAASGLTVPGFSASLMLLVLGFYRPLINSASTWGRQIVAFGNFDNALALLTMIGAFGLGILVGLVLISKLMAVLLAKFRNATYFTILGFVIGSFFVLYFNFQIWQYYLVWGGQNIAGINPTMKIDMEIPVGILLTGIFAFFSYMMVRAQANLQLKNKK
ncbi:MAG: DUF368 domain-containing protein [Bacilli bacterium]|nr:DUF368 domain-containing protein [Bacilli bacterium]